jgi:hypothetical protein
MLQKLVATAEVGNQPGNLGEDVKGKDCQSRMIRRNQQWLVGHCVYGPCTRGWPRASLANTLPLPLS